MSNETHLTNKTDEADYTNYQQPTKPAIPRNGLALVKAVAAHSKMLAKLAKRGYNLQSRVYNSSNKYQGPCILYLTSGQKYAAGIVFQVGDSLYRLEAAGAITLPQDQEWSFDPESNEGKNIESAITALIGEISDRAVDARRERKRRNRVILKWFARVLAVMLVLGGIGAWIYYGHTLPEQARAIQRAQYDADRPMLPGEGGQLTAIRPATMSDQAFAQIPWSTGDSDPLTSPRVVKMDDSGSSSRVCASLPQMTIDRTLRLAVPQSSPYKNAVFYLGLGSESKPVICALTIGNESATIAVQIGG